MNKILNVSAVVTAVYASETAVPTTEIINGEVYNVKTTVAVSEAEEISADKGFKTMGDLYGYWYETASDCPYPDYVCGVWTETGDMSQLVVAVTKDEKGEAGKQEILSLIEDDNSVSFMYQAYSYRELSIVNDFVTERLRELGINNWGCGIDEMENVVSVDIDTSLPEVKAFMEECFTAYANMVKFSDGVVFFEYDAEEIGMVQPGGGAAITVEETLSPSDDWMYTTAGASGNIINAETIAVSVTEKEPDMLIILAAATAAVILIGLTVFAAIRLRIRATDKGNVTDSVKLNFSQVEAILRNSSEQPPEDMLEKIKKRLDT